MPERLYVNSYSCAPNEACFCSSGLAFGECCGSTAADRKIPSGINIIHGFVSKPECRKIVRLCEKQDRSWLKIATQDASGKKIEVRDRDRRNTQTIGLEEYQGQFNQLINDAFVKAIEPMIQRPIEFFEVPYVLWYKPGGFYIAHADADAFDQGNNRWYRAQNRDVSVLVYLNDDYEGGELFFPNFDYTYKPQAGDCLFFPSGNLYLHESKPIRSGAKLAVVCWGALEGTPRVPLTQPQQFLAPHRG